MKARIIGTGEIIDLKGTSIEFGTATWIDSNNILRQGKLPNGDLELLEQGNPIDWEQRRYEIAKDIVAYSFSTPMENVSMVSYIHNCVQVADMLIEELKMK